MKDVASILGSLFGGASGTGTILATLARDSSRGITSIAHLARETRMSEAKALREVNRLISMGLVVTELRGRYRHVALNTASPFHEVLVEMLYLAYGVRPQSATGRAEEASVLRDDRQMPIELVRFIPDVLHPETAASGERAIADDRYDGPSAACARMWERRLTGLAAAAGQAERLLQDAYRTWREERDRDLIHQVLHLGTGASYAARVLSSAADHAGIRTEGSGRLGSKEWQLAVAATEAEAELCRATITALEQAIDLAESRRREQVRIRELEHRLDTRTAEPDADTRLEQMYRRELAERRAALSSADEQLRGSYRTGGLGVSVEDVGTAGERLIVARLREVADTATTHAAAMRDALATATGQVMQLAGDETPA